MNSNIRNVSYLILVFFAAIVLRLTQLHYLDADELTASQYNKRSAIKEYKSARGLIKSADGAVLARSEEVDGRYKRIYPQGDLFAHIVGFSHPNYGRSGAEAYLNPYLSIDSSDHLFKRLASNLTRQNLVRDITLTVDSRLQTSAKDLLGSRTGAIVVMEVKTGDVLVSYSNPSFDPNQIDQKWRDLIRASDSPLLSRSTQGLYPPGSMMKIITAAGALSNGISKDSSWNGPGLLEVTGGKVRNYKGQASGRMTLKQAMAKSSNTIFAQVGLELKGRLIQAANNFGFGQKPDVDFAFSQSRIPDIADMDDLELAWTAVGQGRTLISPMHMAMILSSIANKGLMPVPNIVKKQEIADKIEIDSKPKTWIKSTDERVAADIEDMLAEVIKSGTGRSAAVDGVTLAGKTGTAEIKEGKPHSWFGAYGPVEDPQLAVVVLVENAGSGSDIAAPLAREILEQAFSR